MTFILGLPVDFGYDPYTAKLYAREHNGQQPPANAKDPAWIAWHADKITEVMAQFFHSVKAMDEDCMVSLSPNPWEFAYETYYLQDWQTWERAGYLEQLIVQVYRNDMPRFEREIRHRTVQQANERQFRLRLSSRKCKIQVERGFLGLMAICD